MPTNRYNLDIASQPPASHSYSPWAPALVGCWLLLFCLFCALPAWSSAPARTSQPTLVDELKNYPASLRCEELDVATLLRAIGRQAGMTLYVSDSIQSTITLDMDDADLYQLFQLVLQTKDLQYHQQGSSIIVETRAEYAKAGKDIISRSVCPEFGHATELKTQLDTLLSPEGLITVTKHDSCLIIKDHEKQVAHIEKVLAEIDRPKPQVHIEARIVMLAKEAKEALGVKWGYQNYANDTILATKNKTVAAASNLGLDSLNPPATLGVGLVWDSFKLDADLHAMATDDLLHILSAPSIMVLDGMEAEIKQGKEVPYTSSTNDSSNTEFREANLSLKVTPKIIQDNFISMQVDVTNDKVDQDTAVAGQPLIDRQSIKTNLFLGNRATVVIGGIHISSDDIYKGRVPGLGDIPLLGALFRNSGTIQENFELMIFITPTIVSLDLHESASARREEKLDETLSPQIHKKFLPETYAVPGGEEEGDKGEDEAGEAAETP